MRIVWRSYDPLTETPMADMIEEERVINEKIDEIRNHGYTMLGNYRIEEMETQSNALLYKLIKNGLRAEKLGKLDELIGNYLERLN